MSVDYKWMSEGGILLDGSGDIAFTSSPMECATDMVRTRLKSAVNGWKLYRIGAGLDEFCGNTSDAEAEVAIRRRVIAAVSSRYLPSNAFDVRTLRLGDEIQVFVYLNSKLVSQVTININPNNVVV